MGCNKGSSWKHVFPILILTKLPRYTSLVRRNFLRFGKRSGDHGVMRGEHEEMEYNDDNDDDMENRDESEDFKVNILSFKVKNDHKA